MRMALDLGSLFNEPTRLRLRFGYDRQAGELSGAIIAPGRQVGTLGLRILSIDPAFARRMMADVRGFMRPHGYAFVAALVGLALTLAALHPALAAGDDRRTPVDLKLVLAVDVSRSIDDGEFDLQRQGFARALVNPEVVRAIQAGAIGAIAVTYIEWSGADQQRTVVDWMVLRDSGSAQEFAAAMLAAPRSFAGYTSISGAIDYAAKKLGESGFDSARQVIDVSGDGSNNSGRPVAAARDEAVAKGIIVNGLPIINDNPNPFSRPEPKLDDYYRENVIGGVGAFVIVAEDFQSFAHAIMSKLIKEISQLECRVQVVSLREAVTVIPET
jgi:hypothetical protein